MIREVRASSMGIGAPLFAVQTKAPPLGWSGAGWFGGDVCESNTPKTFCAPHNGFEGRGAHQDPFVSFCKSVAIVALAVPRTNLPTVCFGGRASFYL